MRTSELEVFELLFDLVNPALGLGEDGFVQGTDDAPKVGVDIVEIVLSDQSIQVDEAIAQALEFRFYLVGAGLKFIDRVLEIVSYMFSSNYNRDDVVTENINYLFCQLFHLLSVLIHLCWS